MDTVDAINKEINDLVQKRVGEIVDTYMGAIAALVQRLGGEATITLQELEPFFTQRMGVEYFVNPEDKSIRFRVVFTRPGDNGIS